MGQVEQKEEGVTVMDRELEGVRPVSEKVQQHCVHVLVSRQEVKHEQKCTLRLQRLGGVLLLGHEMTLQLLGDENSQVVSDAFGQACEQNADFVE